MKYFKRIQLLAPLLFSVSAVAGTPEFKTINNADMIVITEAMGANFVHNSMMGASKLGTIFGFQVGFVGAQTSTPDLHDMVKAETPSAELKNLYNAGMMGAVGIPLGISFEAVVVPTYKTNSTKLSSSSGAIKWNINDVIPILPVNLALRGVSSTATFSFNQTVAGANAKVTNETTVTGVQLLFSPQLPIVEPYIGVGALSAKNTLEVTGTTGSIFEDTTVTKLSKTVSGTQVLAGIEVNLLLIKLGIEYSKAFDNTRYGAKLSFGF